MKWIYSQTLPIFFSANSDTNINLIKNMCTQLQSKRIYLNLPYPENHHPAQKWNEKIFVCALSKMRLLIRKMAIWTRETNFTGLSEMKPEWKSIQTSVADFNYFLLQNVNQFNSKVIKAHQKILNVSQDRFFIWKSVLELKRLRVEQLQNIEIK